MLSFNGSRNIRTFKKLPITIPYNAKKMPYLAFSPYSNNTYDNMPPTMKQAMDATIVTNIVLTFPSHFSK